MARLREPTHSDEVETVVIGGGQTGLALGYHLKRAGHSFVIIESNERIGDSWRCRWDSLRLFTPARYDSLPGMRFPAEPDYFPTKDEMADYLESYAARFQLPVLTGTRVSRIVREEDAGFRIESADRAWRSKNVVIAMGSYQNPYVPAFAADLRSDIHQVHSSAYRNPASLRPGRVLVVGAGNSGSELARELVRHTETTLAGDSTGELPFRIESRLGQAVFVPFVLRVLFHRVLTIDTPAGRRARPKLISRGGPWIRVKERELIASGVRRTPRVVGTREGLPLLADGRVLETENIIWCTGFRPKVDLVDPPIPMAEHEPAHERGEVAGQPGLHLLGLHFLYSLSSNMIQGAGRDAGRLARVLATSAPARRRRRTPRAEPAIGGGVH